MRFADLTLKLLYLAVTSAMLSACALPGIDLFSQPASSERANNPDKDGKANKQSEAKKDDRADKGGKPITAAAAVAGATTPPTPVRADVQRAFDGARQALAAGRTAEAEQAFVALTRTNPDLAGPYANLGLIHRQAGKSAEAVAALEKAVELSPQRADLHNQLGIAYRMAGDFAKAKASYERSIALDPAYAAALLNLGILYDLYLWDGARALELYDRYLQLAPGGDVQVQRWVTDLRNRSVRKSAEQRKEQG